MFELFDVWKADKKATSRESWSLAAVNCVVPAGRKIALLGKDEKRNTMALRVLSGVEDPDKGAVRRVGLPCWPFDYSGFSDNGATLRQNANFLGRVYGVDADEIARIAIALSGVRVSRGKALKQYLGPDRRALEIGLTLAIQFDWYFVDEKLPKVSQEAQPAVDAALTDRIGRASLIWATTKPEAVRGYCDSALVLDQGTLTFYSDFEDAVEALQGPERQKVRTRDDRKSVEERRQRRAARRARQDGSENAR